MMSEDIHKWSDGRYTLMFDEHTFFVFDNEKEERMTALKTTKRLNEQQAIIKSKDKQLERLYNYFQDYLKEEMSGNAFSEMWDFVKEDESWEDETIYC